MLKQLNKYGVVNSYDLLKSIAVITMIIDHLGAYFYPDFELLRVIGRLSYPLFAFCAGYNQKYNFEISLLGYALLMTMGNIIIGVDHLFDLLHGSILFSIIILRYSMRFIIPSLFKNLFLWFFVLWFLSIPSYLLFSYGSAGIVMGICGYLCAITFPSSLPITSMSASCSLSSSASRVAARPGIQVILNVIGKMRLYIKNYMNFRFRGNDKGAQDDALSIHSVEIVGVKDKLGYKLFLIMSLFLYALLEAKACDFSKISVSILAIEFLGLGWLLKNFSIHKITEAKIPSTILMFLSRYALPIYFFHYELFEIISLLYRS